MKSRHPPHRVHALFSIPLLQWYRIHGRDLPWRRNKNPYSILVSEVMLQQTQVTTVIPYFQKWMKRYPNLQKLAKASPDDVLKSWEGLGYYRRARHLHEAAIWIQKHHAGQFPKTPESIEKLPGVGPYTLGAIGSIAFNLPLPILDGNVIRVLSRWFGIKSPVNQKPVREKLWKLARTVLLVSDPGDFNQAMMDLGATLCTPHSPSCGSCPVRKNCTAYRLNLQDQIPVKDLPTATVFQYEYAGIVCRKGEIAVLQCSGSRMTKLWQFPSVIFQKSDLRWRDTWQDRFGSFSSSQPMKSLRYTVTHHRIQLEAHVLQGFKARKGSLLQWVTPKKALKLPWTAAHRKLLVQISLPQQQTVLSLQKL